MTIAIIASGAAWIWSASCFSARLNLTDSALWQGFVFFSQQQLCFWAVAQWQKTVKLAVKTTSIRSAFAHMDRGLYMFLQR